MKNKGRKQNPRFLAMSVGIQAGCLKKLASKRAGHLVKNGMAKLLQNGAAPEVSAHASREHNPDLVLHCIRSLTAHDVLPKEEVWKLAKRQRTRHDRKARNALVECNTKLVVTIAKNYQSSWLPFPDILQEGNIGLMKAAERFDERYGVTFPTYASWWIHQSIKRAIANQARVIRIPIHALGRRSKVLRIAGELEEELERTPSDAELSAATGEEPAFIRRCHDPLSVFSLDAPLSPDDPFGDRFADTITDENAASPSEDAEHATLARCLEQALATLTEREQEILRLRFGFYNGGEKRTLEEVGQKFKVTRERIRQIEARALRKLRTPSRLRLLLGESELTPADLDGSAWEKDLALRFRKPRRKRGVGPLCGEL